MPRTLVWDGERGHRALAVRPHRADEGLQGFREVLGTKVIALKVGEPEHNTIVERTNDFLEKPLLPGRVFAGRRPVGLR